MGKKERISEHRAGVTVVVVEGRVGVRKKGCKGREAEEQQTKEDAGQQTHVPHTTPNHMLRHSLQVNALNVM